MIEAYFALKFWACIAMLLALLVCGAVGLAAAIRNRTPQKPKK